MELADVCEGCGQLWQRTAMGFQSTFAVWSIGEPREVAVKDVRLDTATLIIAQNTRPLIRVRAADSQPTRSVPRVSEFVQTAYPLGIHVDGKSALLTLNASAFPSKWISRALVNTSGLLAF